MTMSCCSSFASIVVVPVPLPTQNPCIASWNWMEDDIQRLIMPDIAFHRNSTSSIPLNLVPPLLGIISTVYQSHYAMSSPPLKAACMMATTFSQFLGSGSSSRVAAQSHNLMCLALIPDGPLARCSCSRRTALAISSSPGVFSYTCKGAIYMGIGIPSGGTLAYSSSRSAATVSRGRRWGSVGRISIPPPHLDPWIVRPDSYACLFKTVLSPARIRWLS